MRDKIYVMDEDNATYCKIKSEPFINEYISFAFILARIKELETDKYIDSEHKKQRIKELKNLLK